jgi:hypothetical protein
MLPNDPPTPMDQAKDMHSQACWLLDDMIGTQHTDHDPGDDTAWWKSVRQARVTLARNMDDVFRGRSGNEKGKVAVDFWRRMYANVEDAVLLEDYNDAQVWRAEWATRGYNQMMSAARFVEEGE